MNTKESSSIVINKINSVKTIELQNPPTAAFSTENSIITPNAGVSPTVNQMQEFLNMTPRTGERLLAGEPWLNMNWHDRIVLRGTSNGSSSPSSLHVNTPSGFSSSFFSTQNSPLSVNTEEFKTPMSIEVSPKVMRFEDFVPLSQNNQRYYISPSRTSLPKGLDYSLDMPGLDLFIITGPLFSLGALNISNESLIMCGVIIVVGVLGWCWYKKVCVVASKEDLMSVKQLKDFTNIKPRVNSLGLEQSSNSGAGLNSINENIQSVTEIVNLNNSALEFQA